MQFNAPQSMLQEAIDVNDLPHSDEARRDIKLVSRESNTTYDAPNNGPYHQLMRQTFPVIRKMIGDAFFDQLTQEYMRRYPSQDDKMTEVGDRFPQFLLQLSIDRKELDKLRFLPELARLEWLLQYAYFAEADDNFDLAQLADVPTNAFNQITFTLSHTLNLMFTDWPVFDIWCAYQDAKPQPIEVKDAGEGAQWLCIHREDGHPIIDVVPTHVALILGEMMRGHPLGELAKNCSDIDNYLPQMVHLGWLNGFYLSTEAA